MSDQDPLEQKVTHTLTEGDMKVVDPLEGARKQLTPRYEIRVQAKHDPVVIETAWYRQLAEELDKRYDHFANLSPKQNSEDDSHN